MKHLNKVALFGALVAAFFGGCATISNGPYQGIAIGTSTGETMIADINGEQVTIPATVSVLRSENTIIRILPMDNPGYEATQLVIAGKQSVSALFWGNIITGGTAGSTTDAITGSMWNYSNPNFIVPVKKARK